MSYFRSYFSKNNTIFSLPGGNGALTNTAKNPNTEIFYGYGSSKYIFQIDLDPINQKINDGEYVLNENTKHYLNLTNTIFGDEVFLGANNGKGRDRATSFDLILFELNEEWDEGVGFDYEYTYDATLGNKTFDQRPSNWIYRTTLNEWSQEGIYVISPPNAIATIHFDNGNENLTVDVTSYINGILTGGTVNYGLGLAFMPGYTGTTETAAQSVAFFTKYTQTFYEPFVQTIFDDNIHDDRYNFYAAMSNNLHLYVTKNGNYHNLDQFPLVDVLDSSGTPISGLTDLDTIHIKKGIYRVDFGLDGDICKRKQFFFDKWKGLIINGVSISDVQQKFIPVPYTDSFSIGENPTELERYAIQFFGIRLNEKIKRGSVRKIVVNFRSINSQSPVLLDDVYYRLYIKEGNLEIDVFDWTLMDKTNENCFWLDTSYLIPREYYLKIRGKTHTEEIFYKEDIKFEIVSEKFFF